MERTIIDVPKMYADHHVEAVRDTLLQIEGVEDIYADPVRTAVEAFANAGPNLNPQFLF